MKYSKHLTLAVIVLSMARAYAQTPLWQWAAQAASTGNEQANDIVVDANANSFICGSFDGNLSATYGAAFATPAMLDAFIAEYSPAGVFQLAVKIGGSGNDEARGIATNTAGDLYITGYFEGTCDFDPSAGSYTLASAGGKDGFLAKYSSSGTLAWAVRFGGTGDDQGEKVVATGSDIHLTGSAATGAVFYSTSTATAAATATQAGSNFFGSKYNSSGVLQWVVSGGSSGDDIGLDLVADANNVYYIGNSLNTFTVYNGSGAASATLTAQGINKTDAFVLAYSQSGSLVWATNAGSSNNDNGASITQDSLKLYITGDYNVGTISFPFPGPTFTVANGGLNDIFLACLNKSNGAYQWASTQTGSGSNEERGCVIEKMNDGNIVLTGVFTGALNYSSAGFTLTATGTDDIFISAFTNSGALVWSTTAGGTTVDHPAGLASSTTGALYVTGDHNNAATFGTTTLPSAVGKNIFVAKTGCETVGNNTISSSQQICTGTAPVQLNGSVPVASGTTAYTWQQQTAGNWTMAAGTNTAQNYSPPTLTTTTLYRRLVRSSGSCTFASTPVTVTVSQPAGPVSAGSDQTVCATGATLSASALTVGTGTWSVLAGGATITSPNSNTTTVTNLGGGNNTFLWSASNIGCSGGTGTVSITRHLPPGPALAGINQTICATSATMGATTPTAGTGAWSLVSGSGAIVSANSPTSVINTIGTGTNTFLWTITNGICSTATAIVLIQRDAPPSTAVAGSSQTLCATGTTLGASPPAIGTGTWSVVSGGASISFPLNASSAVTGLSAGVNVLQWNVGNGVCPLSTATMSILRDLPPGPASAGTNQTICATSFTLAASSPTTGTGTWSLSGGTATILSPGNQTTAINSLGTGINTFVWNVTNGSCPSVSSTVQIARDDFPTPAAAGLSQTLCSGAATLGATPASVGSGTWTLISGGATISSPTNATSAVTGIANGLTILQWSTGNGVCPVSTSTTSIQRDLLPGPASVSANQTICATTFSLGATTPTTGSGIWSLSTGFATIVSAGSTTTNINSIGTGTNEFVWTVSNGSCPTATASVQIIRDAFPSTASVAPSQTVCSANATLSAFNPTTGSGSWSVLSGTSSVVSPLNATTGVTNLQPGSNTFMWTVANGVCPVSTATTDISQLLPPGPVNAGADQTVCATSVTLAAIQPTAGSGIWSVNTGTATLSSTTSYSTVAAGLIPGLNEFVWTVSNGVCLPSSSTVTITRDDFPSGSVAGTNIVVCSSTATLNGNTPSVGTGTWSLLSGTATILNPLSPSSVLSALGIGTNVLQWTIGNGMCTPVSSTVSVQQDDLPTPASAGANQQLCTFTTQLNGNIPLVGTGQWTLASGTATLTQPANPTSTLTGLGSGTNELVWTISNGVCPSSSDTVVITRDEFPGSAIAGPHQTLCASQTTVTATPPSVGSGSWTTTGSAQLSTPNGLQTEVTQLSSGPNLFIWTVSNGVCPPEHDTVIVNVDTPPSPIGAGPDQQICSNQSTLAALSLTNGTGTWSVASGQASISNPSQASAVVTSLQTGTTVLVWMATNGSCVGVSDTVIILRDQAPSLPVISSPTAVCGQSITLSATVPQQGNVKWYQASGSGLMTLDTAPDVTVTALSQGKALFIYSVTVGVCPPASDSAEVEVWWEPGPADAGADILTCAPASNLSALSPTAGTGTWSVSSGGAHVDNPQSLATNVSQLPKGNNVFRFTIQNGVCPSIFDDVTITRDSIVLTAQAGADIETESTRVNLNATPTQTGQGHWELVSGTGNIQDPTQYATLVEGLSSGNNVFRWVVSLQGCSEASDEVIVQFREFKVPNAITPNGDGKNDEFHINSLQAYGQAKLSVFNRWGGLVYQTTDYRNDWKGTNQAGQQLADDTYFYSLEIPGKGSYTGFVDIKTK